MKFGVVNKSTTVNRFVLHTLQRNLTHLAVITRKKNIKLGILKGGGGTGKEPLFFYFFWNQEAALHHETRYQMLTLFEAIKTMSFGCPLANARKTQNSEKNAAYLI